MDRAPTTNPRFTIDAHGVGHIVFDDPERSLNVLDEVVLAGFVDALDAARVAAGRGRLQVLVIRSGKPGSFIAGADIDAIGAIEGPDDGEAKARAGQAIFMDLEAFPAPTVAAIDGLCLGGGLELALACRFRICSDSPGTRLGFPEVQLGLLPGWGGTTRLPRLVGLQAALDPLLTGNRLRPSKARRIGLVSEVVPEGVFAERAVAFALEARDVPPGTSRRKRSLRTRVLDDTVPGRRIVLATARRRVVDKTGGRYPAPLKILDVLRSGLGRSVTEALALEARAFGELSATPAHASLLHVFHLREAARKTARAVPGGTARAVDRIGVIGAGIMGGGIAQLAAYRDVDVRMKDIRDDAIAGGLQHARELFDTAVSRRKLRRSEADRKMARIRGGLDWHGFPTADLVVEAVVERLDVKRAVLTEAEGVLDDRAVLATNTSSLSVDAMAEALARPERFCGVHFFNPVHRMPLVEIVRGAATDLDTVATAHAFAVALGKVPVVCRDGPGFVVNRILGPYLNEAGHLLADGASVEAIDRVAVEFGMPMGPLRLMDEVGLDIARHAGDSMYAALGERLQPAAPLVALGETDRLGRKNGRGFYRYDKGREAGVDPDVLNALGEAVSRDGDAPDDGSIRERLVLSMVNEAARILEDRIVATAGELDLAMIMGSGFPPFRGGLLRFADAHHPRSLLEMLESLAAEVGARFEPAPTIRRLAAEDRGFYAAFGPGT
ncbi:MAG: enoyl-CoA hydratase/isomerase family protein [Gemmatimonadetes bacterium]|nr:enoyl-CoA hydratase/isomerase family protein [Gemmatimonadota bacterium]NNK62309.1 fatty acid oxidation complex subunit alpha FadJ [Gemmatimonadota bacterium]